MARSRAWFAPAVIATVVAVATLGLFNVGAASPRAASPVSNAGEPADIFDPIRDWSTRRLAEMTADEKARSVIIAHVPGVNPDGMRVATSALAAGGQGFGGLILMRDNIPGSPEDLAAVTAYVRSDSPAPPVIAIDEEGGDVTRLAYDDFAGADTLRWLPASEASAAFAARADLLRSVGVNLNFGIVADVTADRGSFIYWRTLGDDPASASERVVAAVSAEETTLASTLKHFPGHGRSDADSHAGIPTTDVGLEEWLATDAVPFVAGIEAGATAVMFGHLAFPAVDALPASLSPAWHAILRQTLAFEGIAVTDDMLMLQDSGASEYADPYVNAVLALSAGNDALLYVLPGDIASVGIDVPTLVSAIVSGVSPQRLDEAALRLMMFRRSLAPDALTWTPPCEAACLGAEVGARVSRVGDSYLLGAVEP